MVPASTADQSKADFVLACRIARQVGCDFEQTKAEFLKQATPRPKLRRADYVGLTVKNAIAAVKSGTGQLSAQVAEPLVEPKQVVVVDMPDSVLDGRLGEICQRRLAAFPMAYSWGALVTCAGTLVPRSEKVDADEMSFAAHIQSKRGELRTNLYWCPVGSQGSGKTQAIEQALNCLGMWPKHESLVRENSAARKE